MYSQEGGYGVNTLKYQWKLQYIVFRDETRTNKNKTGTEKYI